MKIAVLDPSLFTLPYDDRLCRALGADGHIVQLFTRPRRGGEEEGRGGYTTVEHFYHLSEYLRTRTGPGLLYKAAKGLEHIYGMATLLRRLEKWRPDVIHFQWLPLPGFDRVFLRRLRRIAPLLLTIHDTNLFHDSPASWIQLWGWNGIFREFDRLIVHIQFSRRQLIEKGVAGERIDVIPHGVLDYGPAESSGLANEVGEPYILQFGMLKPYKGADVLLDAFAALPAKVRNSARLRFAGPPCMSVEDLFKQARRQGITSRIDWDLRFIPSEEVPGLFDQASIIAFPYREIDQSGALMAVLPYGKPIIASNVGAFSELLTDRENALLVPPEDVAALSRALETVLTDTGLAQHIGQNSRELATTTLGWKAIAEQTISVYEAVISRSSPSLPWSAGTATDSSSMKN